MTHRTEPIYREMSDYMKDPGEVLRMYSEALAVADRNTVRYMVEEMSERIEEQQNLLNEKDAQLSEKDTQLSEKDTQLSEKDAQLNEKDALILLLQKRLEELENQ